MVFVVMHCHTKLRFSLGGWKEGHAVGDAKYLFGLPIIVYHVLNHGGMGGSTLK